MEECIFCNIIDGKMPSATLYEDDICKVVLDKFPSNLGHYLVIPKKHVINLLELDDSIYLHLFGVAKLLVHPIIQILGATGFNLVVSVGEGGGQRLPHCFIQVIPRFSGDKVVINWERKEQDDKTLSELANKVSQTMYGKFKKPKVETPLEPKQEVEDSIVEKPEPKQEPKEKPKPKIPTYW